MHILLRVEALMKIKRFLFFFLSHSKSVYVSFYVLLEFSFPPYRRFGIFI